MIHCLLWDQTECICHFSLSKRNRAQYVVLCRLGKVGNVCMCLGAITFENLKSSLCKKILGKIHLASFCSTNRPWQYVSFCLCPTGPRTYQLIKFEFWRASTLQFTNPNAKFFFLTKRGLRISFSNLHY